MKSLLESDSYELKKFLEEYPTILEEPAILSFLKQQSNLEILITYLKSPTIINLNVLNQKFKEHYKEIRIIKYLSKLVHFYTIDLMRKKRKEMNRFIPVNEFTEETYKGDLITANFTEVSPYLKDLIANEQLFTSFNNLTKKQQEVLNIIYIKNFTIKETAEYFKESNQNISKIHKNALIKLKKGMKNSNVYQTVR